VLSYPSAQSAPGKRARRFVQTLAPFILACLPALSQQTYQSTQTISTSGSSFTVPNQTYSSQSATFLETVSGFPTSTTVTVSGCTAANACTSLDSSVTSGNSTATRVPSIGAVYDHFSVSASWTGGNSVFVTVVTTITGATPVYPAPGGSGTVTSVATLCPVYPGSPITTSGTLDFYQQFDSETGSGAITIANSRCGELVIRNNAAAVSDTMGPITGDLPGNSAFWFDYLCSGAGGCTLTPNTGTVNGVANLALTQNQSARVVYNGAWLAELGAGSGGGGGSPGGADTDLQFNQAGSFGGNAAFTVDYTNGLMTINPGALSGAGVAVTVDNDGLGSNAISATSSGYSVAQPAIAASATAPFGATGIQGQAVSTDTDDDGDLTVGVQGFATLGGQ
jgi:hypothetical protein